MEKYGVEETQQPEKTSQDNTRCIKCGSPIADPDTTGGNRVCPKCGTEPYEAE